MTDLNGGNGPVIKLEEGQIKGNNVKVGDSFSMDIFYGVPFAEPPIDDNRFEVNTLIENTDCFYINIRNGYTNKKL